MSRAGRSPRGLDARIQSAFAKAQVSPCAHSTSASAACGRGARQPLSAPGEKSRVKSVTAVARRRQ
ncbi:hypothetical protein M885DRAFT_541291 [Pelagophyceae sp. CCMP2097]|nr:hypothetical protein M885DRAFT_541291 [Pelagophyceae sp. CCMP2097]